MMRGSAKISALAALAAAATLRAAPIDQGAGAVSMPLESLLEDASITAAQIKYTGSFVTDEGAAWARGVAGQAEPGSVTLTLKSGSAGSIERGLRLRYDASQAVPLTVDACRFKGDAACRAVSGSLDRSGGSITADGATWSLRIYKNPCRATVACELYVSSWELAMRARGDGVFPRVASVVDWGDGLALVDVERRRVALTLSRGPDSALKTLGTIEDLTYDGFGGLVLHGSSGRLALDFAEDKAFLAVGHELGRADTGLAGLGRAGFDTLVTLPSTDARLLALRPGFALWTTHSVAWGRASAPVPGALKAHGRKLLATAEAGEMVYALEKVGAEIHHLAISGDAIEDVAKLATADADTLVLSGTSAFERRGTELKLVGATGSTPTTLTGTSDLTLVPGGGAVVRRQQGTECRLVHYVPNEGSPATFRETGLASPCGASSRFASSGERRATITALVGSTLKVHLVTTAKKEP